MREKLLRSRASGIFTPFSNDPSDLSSPTTTPSSSSETDLPLPLDLDDLPLSQRLSLLRQSSLPAPVSVQVTAETAAFNSHQPQRNSSFPNIANGNINGNGNGGSAARQAQLARFRNSVAADLREAALPGEVVGAVVGGVGLRRLSGSGASVFAGGQGMGMGMGMGGSASLSNLHLSGSGGGGGSGGGSGSSTPGAGMWTAGYPVVAGGAMMTPGGMYPTTATTGYAAVPVGGYDMVAGYEERGGALRSMEMQRSIMLGQMDAEAQRRMMERWGKQRFEREFEERMRSGELLGAHRDAMRKLQGGVKE